MAAHMRERLIFMVSVFSMMSARGCAARAAREVCWHLMRSAHQMPTQEKRLRTLQA